MIIQIVTVLACLATFVFIENSDNRKPTIRDHLKTVSFLNQYNDEPYQASKPLRYFDLSSKPEQEACQNEEIFKKVSSRDLEQIIGGYTQNEPHNFIVIFPNGTIEIKHILFSRWRIWDFPFTWLILEDVASKYIYIQTTCISQHEDLKNLSKAELLKSKKLLWINALYFFTGESFYSNDLIKIKDTQFSHNKLMDKDLSKKLDYIFPTIRSVLLKTISFKHKKIILSPLTNALPIELIEHIKTTFTTKKSISNLTKKQATEFYSWICEHATGEFDKN